MEAPQFDGRSRLFAGRAISKENRFALSGIALQSIGSKNAKRFSDKSDAPTKI
jgi:hypothetical protein